MITPLHGSGVQGKGGDYAGACSWLDLDRGRAVFAGREGGRWRAEPSRANRSRFLPPVARAEGWTRSVTGRPAGASAQSREPSMDCISAQLIRCSPVGLPPRFPYSLFFSSRRHGATPRSRQGGAERLRFSRRGVGAASAKRSARLERFASLSPYLLYPDDLGALGLGLICSVRAGNPPKYL
jgi:hypothetical protein